MRTETITVRKGELLGPVDWSYDFDSHRWDRGGSVNPEVVAKRVESLRVLCAGRAVGEAWEATTYGGWPRCGWGAVLAVGMYDGWPYWRPIPSVLIAGNYGGEWSSFCGLSDIRRSDHGSPNA